MTAITFLCNLIIVEEQNAAIFEFQKFDNKKRAICESSRDFCSFPQLLWKRSNLKLKSILHYSCYYEQHLDRLVDGYASKKKVTQQELTTINETIPIIFCRNSQLIRFAIENWFENWND